DGFTFFIQANFDGAAGGTVATGGVFPLDNALVGHFDRVFLSSTK
ncbi:MAG: hypothetical protein HOG41_13665, partial [Gammaproteobacteria bacterium]|nr:hypothetical protein [Gammaproteobacteria bacterium]